ncbi:MAG: hypothetical protein O2910_02740 [Proteobacteria bacterium]|nr:hypothetical protein [Pseudomonadota bacterium]
MACFFHGLTVYMVSSGSKVKGHMIDHEMKPETTGSHGVPSIQREDEAG